MSTITTYASIFKVQFYLCNQDKYAVVFYRQPVLKISNNEFD